MKIQTIAVTPTIETVPLELEIETEEPAVPPPLSTAQRARLTWLKTLRNIFCYYAWTEFGCGVLHYWCRSNYASPSQLTLPLLQTFLGAGVLAFSHSVELIDLL